MSSSRSKSSNSKILISLAIVLAVGAVFFNRKMNTHEVSPKESSKGDLRRLDQSVHTASAPERAESEKNLILPLRADARVHLEQDARRKFGESLNVQWGPNGFLAELKKPDLKEGPFVEGFSPKDSQVVTERSKAILRDLEPGLGISVEKDLTPPIIRGGEISAQAYYQQTVEGLPVRPFGSVSTDLGPNGQLISVYSSVSPNPKLINQRKLSEADARKRLEVPGANTGRAIVWMAHPFDPSGSSSGRYAYEYVVAGKQIIIDAQTGEKIHEKDLRQQ